MKFYLVQIAKLSRIHISLLPFKLACDFINSLSTVCECTIHLMILHRRVGTFHNCTVHTVPMFFNGNKVYSFKKKKKKHIALQAFVGIHQNKRSGINSKTYCIHIIPVWLFLQTGYLRNIEVCFLVFGSLLSRDLKISLAWLKFFWQSITF